VDDLLKRHAGLIHKIAYAYCRDATAREDLVQEIAVQLWRSRDRYDPAFRETTWIYRIALNVAISFYRRERRHAHDEIDDNVAAQTSEPDRDLRALVDTLDPLERALVVLYLEGNEHAEIADVLGISISNVGTKLGRIKDKLRAAGRKSHGAR
jgi:RNA polymerase sigma factor (sigma-70 family)